MQVTYKTICTLLIVALMCSCQKDFLEKKSNKALLVPTTLDDFEKLLNNQQIMNVAPGLCNISADDYYTTASALLKLSSFERNTYLWEEDIFEGQSSFDWNAAYRQIFYANVVLDGLQKQGKPDINQEKWNALKGTALFYRAIAFFQLTQEFTEPYESNTASNVLGIPIKTNSDVNIKTGRGTLQQTFDQIISDLKIAESLLPITVKYKTKPSKPAVFGLLARIYLVMNDYVSAERYANECLKLNNNLIDYNNLDGTIFFPVPSSPTETNVEVLFHTGFVSYSFTNRKISFIDENFYNLYEDHDLRKNLFFTKPLNGVINFRGNYSSADFFCGIATDEIFLIRAECAARRGDVEGALKDINSLLEKRIEKDFYDPYVASSAGAVLIKVISERRKELIGRGIRWSDLRRLNLEPEFQITLERNINNKIYKLLPKDKRYTLPIPDDEIRGNDIPQNIR